MIRSVCICKKKRPNISAKQRTRLRTRLFCQISKHLFFFLCIHPGYNSRGGESKPKKWMLSLPLNRPGALVSQRQPLTLLLTERQRKRDRERKGKCSWQLARPQNTHRATLNTEGTHCPFILHATLNFPRVADDRREVKQTEEGIYSVVSVYPGTRLTWSC